MYPNRMSMTNGGGGTATDRTRSPQQQSPRRGPPSLHNDPSPNLLSGSSPVRRRQSQSARRLDVGVRHEPQQLPSLFNVMASSADSSPGVVLATLDPVASRESPTRAPSSNPRSADRRADRNARRQQRRPPKRSNSIFDLMADDIDADTTTLGEHKSAAPGANVPSASSAASPGKAHQPNRPRLVYIFGVPACGKNYVGDLLEISFGYRFYDGDAWLPPDLRESLARGRGFSAEQRDRYYQEVVRQILTLLDSDSDTRPVAVAQATFKNIHRQWIRDAVPDARMWWVRASPDILQARLAARHAADGSPVDAQLGADMRRDFEIPTHAHEVVWNDENTASPSIVARLRQLLAVPVAARGAPVAASEQARMLSASLHAQTRKWLTPHAALLLDLDRRLTTNTEVLVNAEQASSTFILDYNIDEKSASAAQQQEGEDQDPFLGPPPPPPPLGAGGEEEDEHKGARATSKSSSYQRQQQEQEQEQQHEQQHRYHRRSQTKQTDSRSVAFSSSLPARPRPRPPLRYGSQAPRAPPHIPRPAEEAKGKRKAAARAHLLPNMGDRVAQQLKEMGRALKEAQRRAAEEERKSEVLGRSMEKLRELNDKLTMALNRSADLLQQTEERAETAEEMRRRAERRARASEEKLAQAERRAEEAEAENEAAHAKTALRVGILKAELGSASAVPLQRAGAFWKGHRTNYRDSLTVLQHMSSDADAEDASTAALYKQFEDKYKHASDEVRRIERALEEKQSPAQHQHRHGRRRKPSPDTKDGQQQSEEVQWAVDQAVTAAAAQIAELQNEMVALRQALVVATHAAAEENLADFDLTTIDDGSADEAHLSHAADAGASTSSPLVSSTVQEAKAAHSAVAELRQQVLTESPQSAGAESGTGVAGGATLGSPKRGRGRGRLTRGNTVKEILDRELAMYPSGLRELLGDPDMVMDIRKDYKIDDNTTDKATPGRSGGRGGGGGSSRRRSRSRETESRKHTPTSGYEEVQQRAMDHLDMIAHQHASLTLDGTAGDGAPQMSAEARCTVLQAQVERSRGILEDCLRRHNLVVLHLAVKHRATLRAALRKCKAQMEREFAERLKNGSARVHSFAEDVSKWTAARLLPQNTEDANGDNVSVLVAELFKKGTPTSEQVRFAVATAEAAAVAYAAALRDARAELEEVKSRMGDEKTSKGEGKGKGTTKADAVEAAKLEAEVEKLKKRCKDMTLKLVKRSSKFSAAVREIGEKHAQSLAEQREHYVQQIRRIKKEVDAEGKGGVEGEGKVGAESKSRAKAEAGRGRARTKAPHYMLPTEESVRRSRRRLVDRAGHFVTDDAEHEAHAATRLHQAEATAALDPAAVHFMAGLRDYSEDGTLGGGAQGEEKVEQGRESSGQKSKSADRGRRNLFRPDSPETRAWIAGYTPDPTSVSAAEYAASSGIATVSHGLMRRSIRAATEAAALEANQGGNKISNVATGTGVRRLSHALVTDAIREGLTSAGKKVMGAEIVRRRSLSVGGGGAERGKEQAQGKAQAQASTTVVENAAAVVGLERVAEAKVGHHLVAHTLRESLVTQAMHAMPRDDNAPGAAESRRDLRAQLVRSLSQRDGFAADEDDAADETHMFNKQEATKRGAGGGGGRTRAVTHVERRPVSEASSLIIPDVIAKAMRGSLALPLKRSLTKEKMLGNFLATQGEHDDGAYKAGAAASPGPITSAITDLHTPEPHNKTKNNSARAAAMVGAAPNAKTIKPANASPKKKKRTGKTVRKKNASPSTWSRRRRR